MDTTYYFFIWFFMGAMLGIAAAAVVSFTALNWALRDVRHEINMLYGETCIVEERVNALNRQVQTGFIIRHAEAQTEGLPVQNARH